MSDAVHGTGLQTPARLLYATPRRFMAQPELGGQTWN